MGAAEARSSMKLNIANPATGAQKLIVFMEKRIASEIEADPLGDEFKGYVFKIAGGQDKRGFPMKQGVLTEDRVKLMLHPRTRCCRGYGARKGERNRKSVRGCIVSHKLSVLYLTLVKKGEQELPGLTDKTLPRRLAPKRASKIRKLFNLSKEDDVRKFVVRRDLGDKKGSKAPKIQRLVTPVVLQRKRHRLSVKKASQARAKAEAAEYQKLLALRQKEAKERRAEKASQRRSQRSSARASEGN